MIETSFEADKISRLKTNIIAIGRLLWDKDLVGGLNGNISVRVDDNTILLTGHKTCLGLLHETDILLMTLEGEVLEEGKASSEKLLHTEVYKSFPETHAVVHTHTTYTNAYFLKNTDFVPQIFEAKFYLGEIKAVPQNTPSVTDASAVIEAFKGNNVVVLRNHGVVAMGKELFDGFLLIQALEEAIKIDAISRLYDTSRPVLQKEELSTSVKEAKSLIPSYVLFSQEQMDAIVALVNADATIKDLGASTNMTMELAICLEETGQIYSFQFEQGRIASMGTNEEAEFLITASEKIWRAVFNQEIDPFVATTQKKMDLRGDFARISKWYAPCSRLFELWQQVPVAV